MRSVARRSSTGNDCSMVRSFCSVAGSSLRGDGSCVRAALAASTTSANPTSRRIIDRKRRSSAEAGDAPGPASRDRGRSSSALAPATANSSASTANLTSIARPQSVSTKPRQAGTWTNKLSSPAVASTGAVPAAISEKRRTHSICSARRSRGEPSRRSAPQRPDQRRQHADPEDGGGGVQGVEERGPDPALVDGGAVAHAGEAGDEPRRDDDQRPVRGARVAGGDAPRRQQDQRREEQQRPAHEQPQADAGVEQDLVEEVEAAQLHRGGGGGVAGREEEHDHGQARDVERVRPGPPAEGGCRAHALRVQPSRGGPADQQREQRCPAQRQDRHEAQPLDGGVPGRRGPGRVAAGGEGRPQRRAAVGVEHREAEAAGPGVAIDERERAPGDGVDARRQARHRDGEIAVGS